jgi:hypothetical protein
VAFSDTVADDADLERRFGGLKRLYGARGYARVRAARVAVVGLGGVGSWAVEALARSGVAQLVLIDLDHVSESNVNRQIQALGATLGMSKAEALARRIADIHPGCVVHCIEEFVDDANWPGLLPIEVDAVIDACDQSKAKLALAAWAEDRDRRPARHHARPAARQPAPAPALAAWRAAHRQDRRALRVLARKRGAAGAGRGRVRSGGRGGWRRLAGRRHASRQHAQLPRLRLHRGRHRKLRHGRRGRGHFPAAQVRCTGVLHILYAMI